MISKELIQNKFREIQGSICSALSTETGQAFKEDNWDYESGEGGGITRIFTGDVIEKGGVNYSALNGKLSGKIASKLKGGDAREFYASGVSLVIHPQNPFVPTVHMTQNELWDNEYLIMKISKYANNLGKKRCPNGYRILSNFGTDAMQTQSHAHVHVIGGVNLGLYMNGSPPIKTQKYN